MLQWILTCQREIWGVSGFPRLLQVLRTQPQLHQSASPSERVDQSAAACDEYSWVRDSNLWASLCCSTASLLGLFHGHKLHFLMNGKRKNALGLNWDPSFTEIIGGKQQKRDEGIRQKRWQWLRFQKVLTALPQEKPFSWSLDPRVNKCRLPPCLTDTTPCTVYTLQATHSMTATVRPRPSPDLWVIHTAATPPVHTSAQYRLTKTARGSRTHGWRTQVRWLSVFLRLSVPAWNKKTPQMWD